MGLSTLGLDSSLLDNLARLGYVEPTQVQKATHGGGAIGL